MMMIIMIMMRVFLLAGYLSPQMQHPIQMKPADSEKRGVLFFYCFCCFCCCCYCSILDNNCNIAASTIIVVPRCRRHYHASNLVLGNTDLNAFLCMTFIHPTIHRLTFKLPSNVVPLNKDIFQQVLIYLPTFYSWNQSNNLSASSSSFPAFRIFSLQTLPAFTTITSQFLVVFHHGSPW